MKIFGKELTFNGNKVYHAGNKPTASEIGAAASSHTHNYAGSSSAGGAANSALTATKATQDSAGQQINKTYIKGLSVSGKTITYTKGDGTTGTITTQDTNTTYSTGTSSALGLTKLYTGTGTATDGTMTQAAINTALSGKAASSHTHNYAGSSSAGGAANSATVLATARTINGTSFNGSANITTANWGTARTLTIGNTGKSVNGSGNVSWSLSEIGAAPAGYGLGTVCQDKSGQDCNNILVTGFYRGSNMTNKPSGCTQGWIYLLVMSHDNSSWVRQVAYDFGTASQVYTRVKQNGSWTAWVATDTNTWRGVQDNLTSTATDQSLSANQGKVLKGLIDGKAASSHTHNYAGSSSAGGVANSATKLATARSINGTNFDGTGNITTANWGTARNLNGVSVNGSTNYTIPVENYYCNVNNSNTNLYHRILTTDIATANWVDKSLIIVMHSGYSGGGFGIAKITFRTNDISSAANSQGEIKWLVRNGFAANALVFNFVNQAKNACMDVFYKSPGTYAGMTWYVLSEGGRGGAHSKQWTKYNTDASGTNAYTEANMKTLRTYTSTLVSATDAGHVSTANSANTLTTARTINGTSFNGSANITTANWGTARTITIGNTAKSVNGSANVSWSLSEIGAAAASHTHNYIPTSTGSSISIHADSDSSSTGEYLLLKAGHNELKITSSAGGATVTKGQDKLTFNGNIVYHAGRKPTAAEIGAASTSALETVKQNISDVERNTARANHTHTNITNIASRGNVTCESGTTRPAVSGASMGQVYNNGYPTTYGNVLTLKGVGDGQLLLGWSGTDGAHAPVYVRSKRDTSTANWSGWAQVYTTAHKPTASDVGALPLSGGTMSGYIQLPNTGSSWIDGSFKGSLRGYRQSTGSYHPIITQTTSSGHKVSLGGLGDDFGFHIYDKNRTTNGVDKYWRISLEGKDMYTDMKLTIQDNWLYTTGNNGWYNSTYGGGIYMKDSTWVRIYADKNFYTGGEVQCGRFSTRYINALDGQNIDINLKGRALALNCGSASGVYVDFRPQWSGSKGTEPCFFNTSGNGWGYIGGSGYSWYRVYGIGGSVSDRNKKYDITKANCEEQYENVKNLNIYNYRTISDKVNEETGDVEEKIYRQDLMLGCMVDELPTETVFYDNESGDGKAVDMYSYTTMIAGAVKHLINKFEQLEKENEELKYKLENQEV